MRLQLSSPLLLPSLLFYSLRREWEGKDMKEKRKGRNATEMSCTPVSPPIVKLLCDCQLKLIVSHSNKLHSSTLILKLAVHTSHSMTCGDHKNMLHCNVHKQLCELLCYSVHKCVRFNSTCQDYKPNVIVSTY